MSAEPISQPKSVVYSGTNLRSERKAQGLSREALGEISDTAASAIKKLESGMNGGNWATIQRLADALGIIFTTRLTIVK